MKGTAAGPCGRPVRGGSDLGRDDSLLTDVRFGRQVKDHVDVLCVEDVIQQL